MVTKTSHSKDSRAEIVDYIEKQLIGPFGGVQEVLSEKPHKRYLMGILFPLEAVEDDVDDETPEEKDNTVSLSSEFKPSSMALSFALAKNTLLKIVVKAGSYEKTASTSSESQKTTGSKWQRVDQNEELLFDCNVENSKEFSVFSSKGRVSVVKRPWSDGWIVTVALSNDIKSGKLLNAEECLFQSSIYCETKKGRFKEYPSSDRFRFDKEQQELALLYRKRVNWAVGHGCSTGWEKTLNSPQWISSATIPAKEVYGFSTTINFDEYPDVPKDVLQISWLVTNGQSNKQKLIEGLYAFIAAFSQWIVKQENEKIDDKFAKVKSDIIQKLKDTEQRMNGGVAALARDEKALQAFCLANEAMLLQMIHGNNDFSGQSRARNEKKYKDIDCFSAEYQNYCWRPFQLAFQLLVLESLIFTESGDYSDSRDIVDLLWFPTGGGKTEAYLAVAAWELIYRRLEDGPKGGGTAVIKRYTLRLLTSQQFQRAGTMICALESLRIKNERLLGKEKFSLGLWVGKDSAPNKFTSGNPQRPAALELYKAMREEREPENPFQLKNCPWCGTEIVPKTQTNNSKDYGVSATENSFSFNCPTDSCTFHNHLPIQVVDEALYERPPSMLIGTVDKFARLAWMDETYAFFGKGLKYNPPSLIIQDELHLISGPLGTIAGIYEAGIDSLIRELNGRAKVIAATATIRAADMQCRRLFGREAQVFPSPGLDEADSFFSKEDTTNPGRLYLGIMPSGHTGQTALVQSAAAILQSPIETEMQDANLDAWWTLPIYHNSRRELGKTMTLARDDIPARIEVISSKDKISRSCETVEELSANVKGAKIPEVLEKLSIEVGAHGVVDVLPCTNMISVGVDISRLGTMLINGQPKTTSEYIQASSRVGRDKKRPPAIVVTLYSPSKPRDRSHYETFTSYHQALYRHVEPTSITPWAPPARERALHAALITLIRLSSHLPLNRDAGEFDKNDNNFMSLYQSFKNRILEATKGIEETEVAKIFNHLDSLVDDWEFWTNENEVNCYESHSKQFWPLMGSFGTKGKGKWKTLNSMRSVDTETKLSVIGENND